MAKLSSKRDRICNDGETSRHVHGAQCSSASYGPGIVHSFNAFTLTTTVWKTFAGFKERLSIWNLPLPPDIMNHIIDTYNDIPTDIPTIIALIQSYPVLQELCLSKLFQNLYISCMAGRTFPDFEFLAHVIQVYPFLLDRVKSLTLEGPFERKQLTGSSYVLSQITERSHNLVRLSLAHSIRTWEESDETLRKHILCLLSQNRLHTVKLCFYWIPIELLHDLPDLKRLEVDRFPNRPALDVVPVQARQVKVEELALIDERILLPKSPFDFSTLKVFEVHRGYMSDIQEIINISAASLRKLVLDVCNSQSAYCVFPPTNIMMNRGPTDINLGVLSCLEHITLTVQIESFSSLHLPNGDVIQQTYLPLPPAQLQLILKTLATCNPHNSIREIRLVISPLNLEDLGPCDWLSLDSFFEHPETWKALNEMSIFTVQHGANIHEVLSEHLWEQIEHIKLPCLKGRGVTVNWRQYAPVTMNVSPHSLGWTGTLANTRGLRITSTYLNTS
ncbi:uncharacterized protein LACBIDRAFT_328712 [Laccaria bicolor S238N-H82]|uniref:Predicted protein n=1 Tax=Laccaria bicolor (strain S238N-H82 / ATCC MYA-4686) TaxID=486041 RepID=B0DFR9_LACBS|nr:uncharacterized protein LACBIDRAFT_328712 [Laccaria bicolor S238N-H82]EDR06390.1 predicted protein [Laccaria bicolor S238N-H82]|eukprot:XP_001882762.1 predicted protein [Laccaria bicolor S238N-H82]